MTDGVFRQVTTLEQYSAAPGNLVDPPSPRTGGQQHAQWQHRAVRRA